MFKRIETAFSVDSIGYTLDRVFPRDFVYEGESHPSVEIVYVESGKLEVVEDEKVYIMESGDLIVHGPMEFHRLKSTGNTSPHVFNISVFISGKAPHKLYSGVFRLDRFTREEFVRIFKIASEFVQSEETDVYYGQEVAGGISAFLVRICREGSLNNNLSEEPCAALYRNLVRTMNEEVFTNLSLSELAMREHISVSYVKALFYRYAGISPKSYYISLRANEAARLLSGNLSVGETAEKMNFSSPNYFSLFFKKHLGVTPYEYKKNIRNLQAEIF